MGFEPPIIQPIAEESLFMLRFNHTTLLVSRTVTTPVEHYCVALRNLGEWRPL